MSLRRIIYALLVAVVAVGAALGGAVAGGVAVYQGLNKSGRAPVSLGGVPAGSTQPGQTIVMDTTDIQTSITKAVQKVGSAVVTV
ncbi:MAG TPA: hypothetical protein VIU39_09415, partial [Anaerolineales bacterium]